MFYPQEYITNTANDIIGGHLRVLSYIQEKDCKDSRGLQPEATSPYFEVFLVKLAGFKDLFIYILPQRPALENITLLLRLLRGQSVAGAYVLSRLILPNPMPWRYISDRLP